MPTGWVRQEVATSQDVLEEAEEELDRPSMFVNICNNLGRHVQQVGGDPQDAVAGRPGRPSLATARLLVRFRLHQDHPHRLVGPRGGLVRGPQLHHDVAEHARPPRRLRHRSFLDDFLEVAVIADAADVAAADFDDLVPQGELGVPAVQHVAVIRCNDLLRTCFSSVLPPLSAGGDLDAVGTLRSISNWVWNRQPQCVLPFLSRRYAASANEARVLTTLPLTAVSTWWTSCWPTPRVGCTSAHSSAMIASSRCGSKTSTASVYYPFVFLLQPSLLLTCSSFLSCC